MHNLHNQSQIGIDKHTAQINNEHNNNRMVIKDNSNQHDNKLQSILEQLQKIPQKIDNIVSPIITKVISRIDECKNGLLQQFEKDRSHLSSEIKKTQTALNSWNNTVTEQIKKQIKDSEENITFQVGDKAHTLNEIKESIQALEIIPAKIGELETKFSQLEAKFEKTLATRGGASQSKEHLPKEQRAFNELAQHMKTGLEQFVNISELYTSSMAELSAFEQEKTRLKDNLEIQKKNDQQNGFKDGKIAVAKELFEKFPTEFKQIKSIFGDILSEKFNVDQEIDITNENKNDLLPYISGELVLGKYKVQTPAILLNNDVIDKAAIVSIIDNDDANNIITQDTIDKNNDNTTDNDEDKFPEASSNNINDNSSTLVDPCITAVENDDNNNTINQDIIAKNDNNNNIITQDTIDKNNDNTTDNDEDKFPSEASSNDINENISTLEPEQCEEEISNEKTPDKESITND